MKCKCNQCGYEWDTKRNGLPKNCARIGCRSIYWNDKKIHPRKESHGMRYTRVYRIWNGMKQRCNNQHASNYENYGGRKITYCVRWEKFGNFYKDMGEPPSSGHSLDRIDTNGDYEPGNCRWATIKEQANNTRANRFITYNGEIKTILEWSKELKIYHTTLSKRIKNGWPIEKALTSPRGTMHSDKFKILELFGVRKTITAWSKISPVDHKTLGNRLKMGWALTQSLVFHQGTTVKKYKDYLINIKKTLER